MEDKDLKKLLELLNKNEDEIIEYKVNNKDHDRIGKYISALANSAAMLGQQFSYLIWGVNDVSKEIIGTKFYPKTEKHAQGKSHRIDRHFPHSPCCPRLRPLGRLTRSRDWRLAPPPHVSL